MKFDQELYQKEFTKKKKENPVDQNTTEFSHFSVELAGIEPASKRGSHMLSTCLSPDLVFE